MLRTPSTREIRPRQDDPRTKGARMTSARQPTILDVAASSGLSRGTVSRYLNGGKNVSPSAAEAIERAIQESGYRVNRLARSLRNSRTDCIAFLLPQPMEVLFSDPVHGVLARACSTALSRRGLSMVMVMAGDDAERERAVSFLESGHVDGVFMVGSGHGALGPVEQLGNLGLPVVSCGHPGPGPVSGASTVASDSVGSFRATVERLRAQGRRRIAFLGGTTELDETALRLEGYLAGMGERADDALVAVPAQGTRRAAESVRDLVARTAFDALVCVNDVAAAEAIRTLQAEGLRVPDDVAVVGFDNVDAICESVTPAITSVAQDFEAIAESMAALLGEPPTDVLVPTRIVRRASA